MSRFKVTGRHPIERYPSFYFIHRRDAEACARLLVLGTYDRKRAAVTLSEWMNGKGYVDQEEYFWDEKRVWSRPPLPLLGAHA